MSIRALCGACGKVYNVDEKWAGKKVKCKECGTIFVVPGEQPPAPPAIDAMDDLSALAQLEQQGQIEEDPEEAARKAKEMKKKARQRPVEQEEVKEADRLVAGPATTGTKIKYKKPPKKEKPALRNVQYEMPMAGMVDSLIPFLAIFGMVGGLLYRAHSFAEHPDLMVARWAVYVDAGLMIAGVVLIMTPALMAALSISRNAFKLAAPEGAFLKTLAVASLPFAVASLLTIGKFEQADAKLYFGLGLLASLALVALLFRQGLAASAVNVVLCGVIGAAAMFGMVLGLKEARGYLRDKAQLVAVREGGEVKKLTKDEYKVWQEEQKRKIEEARQRTAIATPGGVNPNLNPGRTTDATPVTVVPTQVDPGPAEVPPPAPPLDDRPPKSWFAEGAAGGTGPREKLKLASLGELGQQPALEKLDTMVWPITKSKYAAMVARENEKQTISRVDTSNWTVDAVLTVSASTWRGTFALSPDGEYLVQQAEAMGRQSITVWSMSESKQLFQVPVQSDVYDSQVLGFATPTLCVVHGRKGGADMLGFFDAKTGKYVDRYQPLPSFDRKAYAFSPDGKTLALAAADQKQVFVHFYNLVSGGMTRRIQVPDVPEAFFFRARGVAFSPDGKQLALLMERSPGAALIVWSLGADKVTSNFRYPDLPGRHFYEGASVDFAADGTALLLYGQIVLEPATGRVLGQVGGEDVRDHRVVAADQVALLRKPFGREQLDIAKLASDKLKEAAEAAKKAGPLALLPPPLSNPNWAAVNVQPKRLDPAGKAGAPLDPATAPKQPPGQKPVALGGSAGDVRMVLFARDAAVAVVIKGAQADIDADFWNNPAPPETTIERYDLVSGVQTMSAKLPAAAKLLDVSSDGELALIGYPEVPGEKDIQRLDVFSFKDKKSTAGFVPFNQTPVKTVKFAALLDKDTILTAGGIGILSSWSVSQHRLLWAMDQVSGTPILSPGRKQAVVRQGPNTLVIDAKSAKPLADLQSPSDPKQVMTGGLFSPDGSRVLARTTMGDVRWDLADGIISPLELPRSSNMGFKGKDYLLVDYRLYSVAKMRPVFNYLLPAGRNLYTSPDERHWFVADGANGAVLASRMMPSAEDMSAIEQMANKPPLIHPGVKVAVNVSADEGGDQVLPAIKHILPDEGKDNAAAPVATLNITIRKVPNGQKARFYNVQTRQTVEMDRADYDVSWNLADAGGKVLYGMPRKRINGSAGLGMIRQDQSIEQAFAVSQVRPAISYLQNSVMIPTYWDPSGQYVKPVATLTGQ